MSEGLIQHTKFPALWTCLRYVLEQNEVDKIWRCLHRASPYNKATPTTGLWGPEGSDRLRLQITGHLAHEGGKVVTLTHRPPLPPGISWYSFLEAESTPGHTEMSAATE